MGIRRKDTHGIQFASEMSVEKKCEGISDQLQRSKRAALSLSLTSKSDEHLHVTDTVAFNAVIDLS